MTAPAQPATCAPVLLRLRLPQGKRARLSRLLYGSGPGNGTLVVLPLDQGLEHGPTDFFPHPPAADPEYQFNLAIEGRYSAIALGIGLAEKCMDDHAGRLPLILKLNGKTNIPGDGEATSALFASVEDAVRIGADAVGYTMYVGSPREDQEIRQYGRIRQDCERYGMPLVLWSYPRGAAIDTRGGRNSLYAQDYAARAALEFGADIVRSAGRTMVLFSGGEKNDDYAAVLRKVRLYMQAGATGVMFGRNMWLRGFDDAVRLSREVHAIMAEYAR